MESFSEIHKNAIFNFRESIRKLILGGLFTWVSEMVLHRKLKFQLIVFDTHEQTHSSGFNKRIQLRLRISNYTSK